MAPSSPQTLRMTFSTVSLSSSNSAQLYEEICSSGLKTAGDTLNYRFTSLDALELLVTRRVNRLTFVCN